MSEEYRKKLSDALQYLGTGWVLHPQYVARPAHRVQHSYHMEKIRAEAVAKGKHM